MKALSLFIILSLFCVASVTTVYSSGGENNMTPAKSTKSVKSENLNAFWKKFQSAVKSNNRDEVASMINFPLSYSVLTENGFSPQQIAKDKSNFLKNYEKIFDDKAIDKIISTKQLEKLTIGTGKGYFADIVIRYLIVDKTKSGYKVVRIQGVV